MIAPAELADIWRDPSDPRWAGAFEQIRSVFTDVLWRHPRHRHLRKLDPEESRDRRQELLHEFWIHLAEHPAALEVHRTRGLGGLRTEAWRFLAELPVFDPSDRRGRLRYHLWQKTDRCLTSAAWAEPVGRRLWLHAEAGPPDTAAVPPPDDWCDALEPLPSRLTPQREGQLPPLVRKETLLSFLETALRRTRAPCSTGRLADCVWDHLEPHPDGQFLLAEARATDSRLHEEPDALLSGGPEADELLEELHWAARIDEIAGRVVDGLAPSVAAAAALHFGRATVREIAERLDVSRGKAGNDVQKFKACFAALVSDEELGKTEAAQLLEVVVDTLQVEHFLPDGGGTSR